MDNETLYKYFEGVASHSEEEQIKEWMEASAENRKRFMQERKIFNTLILFADKNKKIPSDNIYSKQKRTTFLKEILKIAAIIVIAFSLGYFLQFKKTIQTEEDIFMQTITVPAGQRIHITLPDGTNVWLNTRTEFSYPVNLATGKRSVNLKGEAYFEVNRNEENPFIVNTSKGIVEVLGTNFNVEDYPDNETFETTLMEGSVKISTQSGKEESVVLRPDYKAVLIEGKLIVDRVSDYDHYRWKEGLICFTDAPFESIMEDFEKYYGRKIIVNNNQVKNYSYTGKFRLSDGIEYALRVLQEDIYFKYLRDDENQMIMIE